MQTTSRTTIRKINGDCLTPILIFNRLEGKQKFLLESSAKHETIGRYSFIGVNPRKTYEGKGTTLTEISHFTGKTYSYEGDLIQSLKQVMPRISQHTEYPFTGGAIGFIKDNEVRFQVFDTVIIFDHMTDEFIIVHTNIEAEQQTPDLDMLIEQITQGKPGQQDDDYELQKSTDSNPFSFYRNLRVQQRAAYLYYVEFANETFIGTSNESVLNVKNSLVTTEIHAVNTLTTNGVLPESLHAIDTVMKASECIPHLLGYIGFNGQIDFTDARNTIVLPTVLKGESR